MEAARVEFGADGIRGVANQWPLVPPVLVRIGKALGQYLLRRSERPQVVIGRDTRASGESILNCLIAGLTDTGVQTVDLGVMTTPGVAFLVREQAADLGIVVSASHNPYDHNGVKVIGPQGLRLEREEELELEQLIDEVLANGFPPLTDVGQFSNGHHLLELYIQDHVRFLQNYWRSHTPLKSLKLVLDCANGAAQTVAPAAFRMVGADVSVVNCTLDGANINHGCGSEHLRQHPHELLALVRAAGAHYGFAFDGDGDRLAIIDDAGHVYDGGSLLYVLATFFQERHELRRSTVVTTQLTNRAVVEALEHRQIATRLVGRGDRNVEAEIWGGDYLLGGEAGGNIIINDGRHTAADAVFTALTLAGVITQVHSLGAAVVDLTLYPQIHRSLLIGRQLALDERRHLQGAIEGIRAALHFEGRVLWWQSTTEAGVLRLLIESAARQENKLETVFQSIVQAVHSLLLTGGDPAGAVAQPKSQRTSIQPVQLGQLRLPAPAVGEAAHTAAMPLFIDTATGVIRLGERDITAKLTPLLYRVLFCLWLQDSRPVKKEELIGFAWRETHIAEGVTDETVAQAISRLGRLLRKLSGGSEYIEPLRGLGSWRLHTSGRFSDQNRHGPKQGAADEQ